jgi:HAE1 family hydrophobic/amphiphilic exporter-1
MTLPELAIRRHVTTLMILVSMVVLGGVAVVRLPLAFMPDIEFPMLFVNLPYPNASPSQVERTVVRPVEDALGSVKGLRNVYSQCDQNGGNIQLEYDWSTNMQVARSEVWEKIDRIRNDLPDDLGDISVGLGDEGGGGGSRPILEGRLSSKRDLSESWELLERRIVKPLERIPGVATVSLDGVRPREVRINLLPDALELHKVDIRAVARMIVSGNTDLSLGKITAGESRYALRALGSFQSVDQIRNLVIRADGLRLSDVADVVYAEPPLEYGRHLDGDFAIGITVNEESKANSVVVCDALQKRIAEMNNDPELQGVNFLVWFSQGKEIRKTLTDLLHTGIYGAILASVVLFLFLRRFSTTLACILCIPFSLVVACGIVWAQGKNLNTLTMLGLIVGIGMLVDNAVVVIENIFRKREEGLDRVEAARTGAREVSLAVIASTLASVIVFLPMIFNKPSEMNIYLKEIAITVCITLLASLFISQTLIPLATSWLIKSPPRPRGRLMLWIEGRYTTLLRINLRHRWITPATGLVMIASAVWPFMKVDKNFGANNSELFVQANYTFSEELSLQRKEQVVTQVERWLEPHRNELMARSIYSFWGDQFAMTRIYLHEGEANAENIAKVRTRLRSLLPEVPGVKLDVQQTGQMWRQDRAKRVMFQLVGEDSEVLGELADQAKRRLEGIPGLIDATASSQQGQQELHVKLDRDLAARYGITPQQAADVVGLTYRGRRLQRFRTPDGEREMRLTLDERRTASVSQLHNLPLWTENGQKVPLASLASFRQIPGASHIQRENRKTSVWVSARYEEGSREQYLPLVTAAMNSMDLPLGYSWTFGQWQQREKESSQEFLVNLLLALMLVFVVMAALFESVQQALALMVALPFALAGAVWTLYLTKTDFDSPAAIGLLLLIGIVVNNGIVMIEHINHYRRAGMPRDEAMVKGGRERLRPILMTAMTTLFGLAPMAVQKPNLAGVYYYSMALVIMGGLAVSTVLTSIMLPTTATLAEDGVTLARRRLAAFGRWVGGRAGRGRGTRPWTRRDAVPVPEHSTAYAEITPD